jgi:hypothetical protein
MGSLGSKPTASRHLPQMANADQVEGLVRSHAKGGDTRSYSAAVWVPAGAARSSRGTSLRSFPGLVDDLWKGVLRQSGEWREETRCAESCCCLR